MSLTRRYVFFFFYIYTVSINFLNVRILYFHLQIAHAVIQFQETGKPVYKVKNVNLNILCDHYGAPSNPLKEQLKNIYRKDQRYWSRRPMTRDMLIYASSDVLSLVPRVYLSMSR